MICSGMWQRNRESKCFKVELKAFQWIGIGGGNEGEKGNRHLSLGSWLKQLDEQGCHFLRTQTGRKDFSTLQTKTCNTSARMRLKKKHDQWI